MFGLKVKVEDKTKDVEKAAEKAAYRNFSHAGASIRKDAAASIEKADGPSKPGDPPHTHRRNFLRRAWRYAADKDGVVIGPRASIVGQSAAAHEYGGEYKGQVYPKRPTAAPALERAIPRIGGQWAGSIGT